MRSIITRLIAVAAVVVGVVVGSAGTPANARPAHHDTTTTNAHTMRVASDWWA